MRINGGIINEESERIVIAGWLGTWYVIDYGYYKGQKVYLLEHERYGDETEHLIVDKYGDVIMDDVWNGFADLEDR